MHHFQCLFKSRRVETQSVAPTNSLRLPTEILIIIVESVKLPPDLARLSRTSKLLQSISQPFLYQLLTTRSISERGDLTPKQQAQLLRTIQYVPRLSALVTELSHKIQPDRPCRSHGSILYCPCLAYERKFGKALALLSSLQNLHLTCYPNGWKYAHEPHPYLLAPTKQRLRRFSLFCYCCDRPEKYTASLLVAPLISSVTTLCLQVSPYENHKGRDLSPLDPNFLPNVKALSFDECWVSNMIMAHRPIERIHILKWNLPYTPNLIPLSRAIASGPGNPKALFMNEALEWLPSLVDNLQSFLNLTVIGIFAFAHSLDEDILDQMSALSPLSHLISIHISPKHAPGKYCAAWAYVAVIEINHQFVDALCKRLPTIKRIMVHCYPHERGDPTPVLWEREDASKGWRYAGSLDSHFSFWDLLEGKAD